MNIAVYPGTFDPITKGHLDILDRAANIFDKVFIAVAQDTQKDTLFTVPERLEMIKGCTDNFDNIAIDDFSGLVVNYAQNVDASVIIRGLRQVSDFEYEFQMALMNRHLNRDIDTIFLMPDEKYSYLSSSIVREITKFEGDITRFVPKNVYKTLKNKLEE